MMFILPMHTEVRQCSPSSNIEPKLVHSMEQVRAALEKAGVIFIDENGEGEGVRFRKKKRKVRD
jgi:hypothetical protein